MIPSSREQHSEKLLHVLAVTGLSGAGKSLALKVLEDAGYYCVDNLPVPLLPGFIDYCQSASPEILRVAIGTDIRSRQNPDAILDAFNTLRSRIAHTDLIFLEAEDRSLHARFRESRRPHPMDGTGNIVELIQRERLVMHPLRAVARWVIDTTQLTPHDLRRRLTQLIELNTTPQVLQIGLISFAYRHGSPAEADLVLDVRFLPNPYFVKEMRALTGLTKPVRDYVLNHETTKEFLSRTEDYLRYLVPQYVREGKAYLTIGVGCTGGRHRSVSVVEHLLAVLASPAVNVSAVHRELAMTDNSEWWEMPPDAGAEMTEHRLA